MRDHYYQLFDLEKNFGEKMFCDETDTSYGALSGALGLRKRETRGNFQGKSTGEKPTDPFGFSLGVETSPAALWINDCCVLNIDEKPDTGLVSRKARKPKNRKNRNRNKRATNFDPCSQIQYSKNGNVVSAGSCEFKAAWVKRFGMLKKYILLNIYFLKNHKKNRRKFCT